MAHHPVRTKQNFIPKDIYKDFNVAIETVNSKTVETISRKDSKPSIQIIYLHGGGYVFEMSELHWTLIKKLLMKLNCRVSILDYPLAPENNYKATTEMVIKTYKRLTEKYAQDKIIIMGDSAGGGLSLSITQALIAENSTSEIKIRLPEKLVLLSPWLDLTLEDPEIFQAEKTDVQLSYDFLKYCADEYAAGADKKDYLLSPIYGSINQLPKTIIFYGSQELFKPDIKRLEARAIKESSSIEFVEYEGMQHDWVLLPIPEAEKVIEEICEFVI